MAEEFDPRSRVARDTLQEIPATQRLRIPWDYPADIAPDSSALLPGDILLKFSPTSRIAAFQRACGPAGYDDDAYGVTHVGIYAGDGYVLESTPFGLVITVGMVPGVSVAGVRQENLLATSWSTSRIAARRMPDLADDTRRQIVLAAHAFTGQPYDLKDILLFGRVWLRRMFGGDTVLVDAVQTNALADGIGAVICTELVEEAYAAVVGRGRIKVPASEATFPQPLPCNYFAHRNLVPVPVGTWRV